MDVMDIHNKNKRSDYPGIKYIQDDISTQVFAEIKSVLIIYLHSQSEHFYVQNKGFNLKFISLALISLDNCFHIGQWQTF